jgi:hypothetical protein
MDAPTGARAARRRRPVSLATAVPAHRASAEGRQARPWRRRSPPLSAPGADRVRGSGPGCRGEGVLRGSQIVQVGLRGTWPAPEDFEWMRAEGFRWHTMNEILQRGLTAVMRQAVAHRRARPGLRARNRHPGARRPHHPRAPGDRTRRWPHARPMRRRHRRSLPALRPRRHHSAWGRASGSRDPGRRARTATGT